MTKKPVKIHDVRLCTTEDGDEAIYVDGKIRWNAETVYLCEVAEYIGRIACKIRHHLVKSFDEEWPALFSELKIVRTK